MSLSFRQTFDRQIDLTTDGGAPVATYRFDRAIHKPCFHPLYTAAGRQITGFQMSDHIWHRGLWFTIKFINGTNFWEERPPFGVQEMVDQPKCEYLSHSSVKITHSLSWTSEATGPIIYEDRNIIFTTQPDGTRLIDWQSSLDPLQAVTLDRTPYTTWGGYSGLTFRASREVHNTSYLLPDGQSAPSIIGQAHPWVILRGSIDGDLDSKISVGIVSHPTNPRSPQNWYAKSGNSYDFCNAAFLFHEPMNLAPRQKIDFKYRVLYRDGLWEAPEFAKLADDFIK